MRFQEISITNGDRRVLDITGTVRAFCAELGSGLCHVFVPHATAGLALMETGSGSEEDLSEALDRWLPRQHLYHHSHGSPGHGADHVLPVIANPVLVLAVHDGEPVLGTWQSIVLVDLNVDNPRRSLILHFLSDPD